MSDGPVRVGRICSEDERAARMAREAAHDIPGEVRRSAFAISHRHVLTAWHCVRDAADPDGQWWFRVRHDGPWGSRYCYIPVRVTNIDHDFDVAALAVDTRRLGETDLSATEVSSLLADAAVPLGAPVQVHDLVQVVGFPRSASGADSDTNTGHVAETALPIGNVTGLKLYCPALAAVDPVDPHGLSGGPVLKDVPGGGRPGAAVGVIRAAPRGLSPDAAAGGSLVASRIDNLADRLPEVAVALADAPKSDIAAPVGPRGPTPLSVSAACSQALRDSVVVADDPARGALTGWPHFLHEALAGERPTAIGTAYGLKIALALGERDGRLNLAALADTLWKLRLPDGGWAARSSAGISRPEVTALALGALATSGFSAPGLEEAVACFEDSFSADRDSVGMTRTYVVSAAIRGLVRVRPQSRRLRPLRAALLEGAIQEPTSEGLLCWPSSWLARRDQGPAPSVAHTAMAVVALARAGRILGQDAASRSAMTQAVRWLVTNATLGNQTEQIRRYVDDNHRDSLTVHHFTAAWVARALLAAPGDDPAETAPLLAKAADRVWRSQRDGVWEWVDNDHPLWMTYQGMSVMRDYALWTSTPAR